LLARQCKSGLVISLSTNNKTAQAIFCDVSAILHATSETEEEADRLLTDAYHKAEDLVQKHWDAIVDLGCELYTQRSLGPNQISVTLSRHGLSMPSEVERKLAKRTAKPAPNWHFDPHLYRRQDGWIGGDTQ
jgi:hypothetical protein